MPCVNEVGVNIELDYKRRDFTINSMYFKLTLANGELNFELIDLANGKNDIKNKTLKVLHDKSYIDDPTRILRGIDFKYRFDFDFSSHDKHLIKECLSGLNLDNASKDRILAVFKKTLLNDGQDEIIAETLKNQFYKLLDTSDFNYNLDEIYSCNKKFNLSKEDKALFYIEILKNTPQNTIEANNPYEIKQAFKKFNMAQLSYYFYKTKDENALSYLKYRNIELKVNGDDLIKLGFKGKIIGEILNSLFNKKALSNEFNSKEDELIWITKTIKKTSNNEVQS